MKRVRKPVRKRAGKKGARGVRRLFSAIAWTVLGGYAFIVLSLVYLRFLPPVTTGVQIQRRVEALIARETYDKEYDFIGRGGISDHLAHAIVAAEDTRFYEHFGFDWEEMGIARAQARREGTAPRGASTITQQLVKNLYFTTHRSYVRKALEIAITPAAELILGKDRILELYLNVIEWGPGVYGAHAAADYHYSRPASDLTRDQAARLAAVVPDPLNRDPARMSNYAGIIQGRMRQMGW